MTSMPKIRFRHAGLYSVSLATCSLLVGCASTATPGSSEHAEGATSPSPALVYASDAMLAWESAQAPADADRFEFSRNDPILGGGPPVALRATDQWPQALRPIERPVNFNLFQQDRSRFGGFDRGFRSGRGFDGRYDGRYRWNGGYRGSSRGGFRTDNDRSPRSR